MSTLARPHTPDWKDATVLVTGATGFVGGWLARRLVDAGARVVCLVRDEPRLSSLELLELRSAVTLVRGAVEQPGVVERALTEYDIGIVFHLGAQTLVGTAQRDPVATFESNIRGTWTLLEACRAQRDLVRAVVVASSDKAYGVHGQLPYREDFALQPRFPYDTSKACADLLARSYFFSYEIPVTVARCANIYGGGDLNWSRVIPGTIRSALAGERPIVRSDGTPVRDYLYIDDAVAAYLGLVAAVMHGQARGEAFNFGTQEPIAVLPLVKKILAACGRGDLTPDVQGTARAEIDRQYLDSSHARQALGWQPAVSLDDGLRRTADWYRARQRQLS